MVWWGVGGGVVGEWGVESCIHSYLCMLCMFSIANIGLYMQKLWSYNASRCFTDTVLTMARM